MALRSIRVCRASPLCSSPVIIKRFVISNTPKISATRPLYLPARRSYIDTKRRRKGRPPRVIEGVITKVNPRAMLKHGVDAVQVAERIYLGDSTT